MTIVPALVAALLIWSGAEFILGFYIWRQRRRMRRELRIEQCRSAFAEARGKLLGLVRDGKVRPDSATFQSLYSLHTFVMRRPDQYREIGYLVWKEILCEGERTAPASLLEEASTWTPETKEVVRQTANGMGMLITYYSLPRRLLVKIEHHTGAVTGVLSLVCLVATFFAWVLRSLAKRDEDQKPGLAHLDRAREMMVKLAT